MSCILDFPGLYSKHVPIVPVLVELWSGQVNLGPGNPIGLVEGKRHRMLLTQPYGAQLIIEETAFINRLAHA